MAKKITLYSGTVGLNNAIDSARLPYDPEKGHVFLGSCINVDIDNSRRITRRGGHGISVLNGTVIHSLFKVKDRHLLYYNGSIGVLDASNSYSKLDDLSTDEWLSYQKIGDKVYYSNGIDKGVYTYDVNKTYGWIGGLITGLTSEVYYDPPAGQLLNLHAGRMFVASGNVIWFSRPFSYSHFRLGRDMVMFEDDILLMKSVGKGIWIGDSTGIYFVSGTNPNEFVLTKKSTMKVVKGTEVLVPSEKIGDNKETGISLLFVTDEGICVGNDNGSLVNLTEGRIEYSPGIRGTAYYADGKYFCNIIK